MLLASSMKIISQLARKRFGCERRVWRGEDTCPILGMFHPVMDDDGALFADLKVVKFHIRTGLDFSHVSLSRFNRSLPRQIYR